MTGRRSMLSETTPKLSEREAEVLEGLALGKNYTETASWLGIERSTVATHLVSIKNKFLCKSTIECVVRALESGQIRKREVHPLLPNDYVKIKKLEKEINNRVWLGRIIQIIINTQGYTSYEVEFGIGRDFYKAYFVEEDLELYSSLQYDKNMI